MSRSTGTTCPASTTRIASRVRCSRGPRSASWPSRSTRKVPSTPKRRLSPVISAWSATHQRSLTRRRSLALVTDQASGRRPLEPQQEATQTICLRRASFSRKASRGQQRGRPPRQAPPRPARARTPPPAAHSSAPVSSLGGQGPACARPGCTPMPAISAALAGRSRRNTAAATSGADRGSVTSLSTSTAPPPHQASYLRGDPRKPRAAAPHDPLIGRAARRTSSGGRSGHAPWYPPGQRRPDDLAPTWPRLARRAKPPHRGRQGPR